MACLMANQTNLVAAEGEAVEGLAGAAVVVVVAVDAPWSSGTVPVQDLIVVMVDDHRGRVERHARYHYRGHDRGRIVGRPPEADADIHERSRLGRGRERRGP